MDVVKTLKPGKNGTKRYVQLYGDNLVAVRYRLDAETQISYTTVELIIERRPAPMKGLNDAAYRMRQNQRPVLVRIHWDEAELQHLIKSAGGAWNPERKLWQIRYELAIKLGLEKRIILK